MKPLLTLSSIATIVIGTLGTAAVVFWVSMTDYRKARFSSFLEQPEFLTSVNPALLLVTGLFLGCVLVGTLFALQLRRR